MNMEQMMKTGAGRYLQSPGAAGLAGGELARLGYRKVGILAGERAFAAARDSLMPSVEGILSYAVKIYPGFCTAEDIDELSGWALQEQADCLLGVGGGKLMDLSKAVGAQLRLPVFTLPTIAATCAAFAALSVIYDQRGHQESIRYHEDGVAGVFADLSILAAAPRRYLAAGIADAFAKKCEYSSMRSSLGYQEIDLGRYMGYRLAQASDEVLLACSRQAFADNGKGLLTPAFNDAVSCLMGITGVISGLGAYAGRGGARFAIAHGFNEIIRGDYVKDPRRFLHGEIVGVGILAQLRANGADQGEIHAVEGLFRDLELPLRLRDLELPLDGEALEGFVRHLMDHCRVEPELQPRVRQAVWAVR